MTLSFWENYLKRDEQQRKEYGRSKVHQALMRHVFHEIDHGRIKRVDEWLNVFDPRGITPAYLMAILTATNTFQTPMQGMMRLPPGTSEFQYFGREVFLRRTYDYLLTLYDKERVLDLMQGFIPKEGYDLPVPE